MHVTLSQAWHAGAAPDGSRLDAEELLRHRTCADTPRDVYLTHDFTDPRMVYGIVRLLEAQRVSVQVGWLDDPLLHRTRVTAEGAHVLRRRMDSCSALVVATSGTSIRSVWLPWELGYFDARGTGRVAVMPITEQADDVWRGQEHLALYPLVHRDERGVVTVEDQRSRTTRWASLREMAARPRVPRA